MHDIDVLWWFCDNEGCEHRAKKNSHISTHKAHVHNVGIQWKQCPDCDFKAKTNGYINKHIKRMHTSA